MLKRSFVLEVIEKIKIQYILGFELLMTILGILIDNAEPYNNFEILFPTLLLMSFSTIVLLKFCLKKMLEYKKYCEEEKIFENAMQVFIVDKTSIIIVAIYILIILVYFLSLIGLQFISLNIMGIYILLFGAGTLFMALIAYESYIRLTISLFKFSTDNDEIVKNYNSFFPSHTEWLHDLHCLSKVLKNASLIMGLLFVFENTLIFYANVDKLNTYIDGNSLSPFDKILKLPIEFWVIWIFVFLAIAIAFPVIAFLQSTIMKKIISDIGYIYSKKTAEYLKDAISENRITDVYVSMKLVENAEQSLNAKYMPPKFNKFIILLTSILTCLLHLTTLYNLFI